MNVSSALSQELNGLDELSYFLEGSKEIAHALADLFCAEYVFIGFRLPLTFYEVK